MDVPALFEYIHGIFPRDIYGDSTLMAYAEILAELPEEVRLPPKHGVAMDS